MPDASEKPIEPIASDSIGWTEWADVPRFGLRYRHLSETLLGQNHRIGVAIEELPPGKQTAPAHYHLFEEEHVFILEGSPTLRLGDGRHIMRPGDYACFPAGQKAGHCLLNETDEPCRYIIIGERRPDEVVIYTDSNKALLRALGNRALFDLDARRGSWDGESTGLQQGQTVPGNNNDADLGPETSPRLPISSDGMAWDDEPGAGTRFGGRSKHLTNAALAGTSYHVGVLIEAPSPGKRLAPMHYHMGEEEHAFVLEGELTLLLGERTYPMKAGDYVAFPAGRQVGHSFLNSGPGPCRYLMIGERNSNDVCIYPQSGKILVRAKGEQPNIFDIDATRGYWDGEDIE
jgi:uncharacterized cupin superfamily protein